MSEAADQNASQDSAGSNIATVSEIADPRRYEGYFLTAIIRQSDGAAVYRAKDERFNREVVIHILTAAAEQKAAAAQFFGEAASTARLRHPALVRAVDVGKWGRQLLLVEEYVRGEALADKLPRLERGRLSESEALRIIRQIALALQALAAAGLCHRWLRPDKILLSEGGGAKLRGAGHARHLKFSSWRDALCENAAWVAPEQIRGDCHLDCRADLYSLGCVWYYALFGQPPFPGVSAETILESQLSAP
ncbi:MAG: protein kinase, partial [Planctomycetota bacterium]|nr:protein kinase [Planctomycetota bacterium]